MKMRGGWQGRGYPHGDRRAILLAMFPPPSLSGRRLLVLGATGFIGRWVARVARSAGATTVLQARSAAALAALRSRWEL